MDYSKYTLENKENVYEFAEAMRNATDSVEAHTLEGWLNVLVSMPEACVCRETSLPPTVSEPTSVENSVFEETAVLKSIAAELKRRSPNLPEDLKNKLNLQQMSTIASNLENAKKVLSVYDSSPNLDYGGEGASGFIDDFENLDHLIVTICVGGRTVGSATVPFSNQGPNGVDVIVKDVVEVSMYHDDGYDTYFDTRSGDLKLHALVDTYMDISRDYVGVYLNFQEFTVTIPDTDWFVMPLYVDIVAEYITSNGIVSEVTASTFIQ